ncbi:MAG: hypothetical protein JW797_20340 [Bradymonadales bacterium]|nr:hypothetical protein [Bradymonadales bacterium]
MKILDIQSPIQRIELYQDSRSGLVLLLDGKAQFYQDVEHRYHECLCVVPSLYSSARRVFVGGGGDGLAATRLLRLSGVDHIVVCDYDEAVTRLGREQEDLVALNQGSLLDERVTVVNTDAYQYLTRTDEQFDLILCDFPDPLAAGLNRVYSREFYAIARQRLAEQGVIAVQTRAVPVCARIIGATLRAVFGQSLFYRFTRHGFTLSGRQPLVRLHPVPPWTRYLSEELLPCLFVLPKDEADRFSPEGAPVNMQDSLLLVQKALVEAYQDQLAAPFAYHPEYLVIDLAEENALRFAERLPVLLAGLEENKRLVLLVDRMVEEELREVILQAGYHSTGLESVRMVGELGPSLLQPARLLVSELDDGSVTDLEERVCRPAEDAEIAGLLVQEFTEPGPRGLGIPDARCSLDARQTFVITRDGEGQPVALFRLEPQDDRTVLEPLRVSGSERSQQLSILAALAHLAGRGVETLVVADPDPPTASVLNRLGGFRVIRYDVYLRRPDQENPASRDRNC